MYWMYWSGPDRPTSRGRMTIEASAELRPPAAPINSLLTSPILPTLLKLALPNSIAMFGTAVVAVAETSYIGRLGVEPLAGIALGFPFVMLTQTMYAGAMGVWGCVG